MDALKDNTEARLDSHEQLIAQLTAAYAEMWVVLESVLSQALGNKTDEEKAEFWKNLDEVRKKMFLDLNRASKINVDGTNSEFADAVENLVTGKSPDKAS